MKSRETLCGDGRWRPRRRKKREEKKREKRKTGKRRVETQTSSITVVSEKTAPVSARDGEKRDSEERAPH